MPQVKMPDGQVVEMPDELTPEIAQRLKALQAAERKPINNATSKALSSDEDTYDASEYTAPANETRMQKLQRLGRGTARDDATNPYSVTAGAGESLLSQATGAISSAAGGLAGVAKTGYRMTRGDDFGTAAGKGAQTSQDIQHKGTYQPRTSSGQLINELAAAPLEIASDYTKEVGGAVGSKIGAIAGGEAGMRKGEAIGESVGEAVPAVAATVAGGAKAYEQGRKPMATQPPKTKMEAAVMEAQDSGYVLPPSQANPSLLNKLVTGYGGKIQTDQAASIKNQPNTNRLVKQALGIAPDVELSYDALETVRKQAGQAYQAVKDAAVPIDTNAAYQQRISNLTKDWQAAEKDFPEIAQSKTSITDLQTMMDKQQVSTTGAIEMVKDLRSSAKTNLKAWDDPAKQALGKAQRQAADALDKLVEDNLQSNPATAGKDLVKDYRAARQLIAKSYDVEAALTDATGNVDALKLAKLLKDQRLTGYLKDVAQFADAFKKNAQLPERIGTHPGVSPLDVATAGIEASVAPTPARAAGVVGTVLGRPIARSMGLSDWYQRGAANTRRPDLTDRKALRKSLAAGYVGAEEPEMESDR